MPPGIEYKDPELRAALNIQLHSRQKALNERTVTEALRIRNEKRRAIHEMISSITETEPLTTHDTQGCAGSVKALHLDANTAEVRLLGRSTALSLTTGLAALN